MNSLGQGRLTRLAPAWCAALRLICERDHALYSAMTLPFVTLFSFKKADWSPLTFSNKALGGSHEKAVVAACYQTTEP